MALIANKYKFDDLFVYLSFLSEIYRRLTSNCDKLQDILVIASASGNLW